LVYNYAWKNGPETLTLLYKTLCSLKIMEQTERKFKELFINQIVKDIKLYHVNENYMAIDPDHKWVIEGGVEFIFEDYTVSLAWNNEMQLYDMVQGEIKELTEELDIYEMDFSDHPNMIKIPGKKVEEINFNWTWYQKMDEEMELVEEKAYIPQEIRIKFEDGILLQLATIIFQFRDKQIERPVYDSQSMILITINQPVEIMEAEVTNDLDAN
jgi:hypothetical protein